MNNSGKNYLVPVFGLVITLGFASLPISKWIDEFADVQHLVLYEIIWWTLIILILLYIIHIEKRDLTSIGFKKLQKSDFLVAPLAGVLITVGLALILFVVFPALNLNEDKQINKLLATPLWWRIISVIRAGWQKRFCFAGTRWNA